MAEFDSDMCANKYSQGCKIFNKKCPCKMKEDIRFQKDQKHWELVVRCKECIHRPRQDSSFRIIPPIKNGKFDETCPLIRMNWKENIMPKKDSFCSLGERDDKERS